MNLSELVEAYLLEGVRAHPDDEDLAADLAVARERMEVAWLEHAIGRAA